ncbi:FAD-dependent oxidoreductase [Candidatus Uhrbacteria bacterium]|nr:FAD-dependent oxidoreductase [Candidatus Uhrbacteria bacterium]
MKHVLIIGAGFAGYLTAKQLAHKSYGTVQITLIDPKDHFLFAPLLIDVLQGDKSPESITIPLVSASKKHGFTFIQGLATNINRSEREVLIETSDGEQTLAYDILVFTTGAGTNYYGNQTAERFAYPLKSLKDAARIKSRIEWAVKQAMITDDAVKRSALLSFCVVGAGATGIEALCSIQDIAFEVCKERVSLRSEMQFHLFQATTQILPGFPMRMVCFALAECERRGFVIHCGVPVTQVTEDSIVCADGSRFEAACVLWAAGLSPNSIRADVPFPLTGAWLHVDSFLRLADDVFAAGDVVAASYQKILVPKNGQTAGMMAKVLTENIWRTLHNRFDLKEFRYLSRGTLLVMGNNAYIDFRFFGFSGAWIGKLRSVYYRVLLWHFLR